MFTKINFYFRDKLALIKIRLGDWDLTNTNETLPFKEFNVSAIVIHPNFNESSLANNIAILTLSSQVNLGEFPTITTGCLPCKSFELFCVRLIVIFCFFFRFSYSHYQQQLLDVWLDEFHY